jgi:alkylation response protein AidB-like acyl-CoA dehydrogenase
MDLALSNEYLRFREKVASILEANRDQAPLPGDQIRHPQRLAWQKLLLENGLLARTVPRRYGGYGAAPDILKSHIIAEEFARSGLPSTGIISTQGVSFLVPTLLELGNEAQKKEWIRPTLYGELIWCQGYSEPGAGSDLASLTTRAYIDGEDYVINGQKIWTSTAVEADMIFCLVRTEADASRHRGISYLYFSMKTDGIEIRPLVDMTGKAQFNEVFFTDVRVPRDQIVAGPGAGWMVANATLKHERGTLGNPDESRARLDALVRLMKTETADGHRLMDNPVLRDRLLVLQARVYAMQANGLRVMTCDLKGENPAMAGLIVKLQGCEINHELQALGIDALGEIGLLYGQGSYLRDHGKWQEKYMYDLGLIIGGGTAQIQKNIISERGLGMPREPQAAVV